MALRLSGKQDEAEYLTGLSRQVQTNDKTNLESVAASLYFPALFGSQFTRSSDSAINAALNYGYAIVRSYLAREISSRGLIPALGIFHCNQFNHFNLADDLIEPYRPFIDLMVAKFIFTDNEFTKGHKQSLVSILESRVVVDRKIFNLRDAIELSVDSLVRIYDKKLEANLSLPEII